MNYFYRISIFICFFVVLNLNSFSEFHSNAGMKNVSANLKEYSVYIPGKVNPDGTTKAANIFSIKKLAPEYYLPNVIHLKTKTTMPNDKGGSVFFSAVLRESLSRYNIVRSRSLLPSNSYSNLLANDEFGLERIFEIQYSDAMDPYDVCAELMDNPEIEYVCPVFKRYTCDYTPNDPSLKSQWAITNMNMKKAWELSKGDKNVKIAIVDCGTDWKHEDLIGNIYENPGEIGLDKDGNDKRTNKIDDDGNGKIDDVNGWDLIGNITYNDVAMGNYREDNDATNIGNGYHGTHVAGCASATTNNSKGIAGIGFNCSIIPIKCSIDNDQQAILRAYDGIAYAANLGADIINCSWGGSGYSPVEQDIINAAVKKGSLVVVAAANDYKQNIDEEPKYPASYNNVLCVGATASNDQASAFSNIGWLVTVYSPGSGIYATMPGNKYQNLDGTSMATPITSGLAGLIKSIHKNWEPKQILHQIRSTSDNVITKDATQRPYYYGRTNANNALDYNDNNSRNIPGVEISEVNFTSGDAITSFDSTKITLKIKNYLGVASDLKVKIKPQGNALSVSKSLIPVGELKTLEETGFDLTVQLTNLNPWFVGYVNLQVTFESGTYTDYQLLKIPVKLASNNSYNAFYTFKDGYEPSEWAQAVAVTENIVWAAGTGGAAFQWKGGALRINGSAPQTGAIAPNGEGSYCVHAFDLNRAYFGTGSSNRKTSSVIRTYDGGSNWETKNLSAITGFINAVYFFNDMNGIILGDPMNGKFGIATSADSGNTWEAIANAPVPLTNENGRAGSAFWLKTYGWFGTTKGRIFRTVDMGYSWKSATITKAAIVYQILFKDVNNGIAIYAESTDRYAPRIVASTNDGGVSWTANKFNFGASQLNPVYIYSCDETNLIILLCSSGQVYGTTDNGTTWTSVLSAFHGNIQIGAGVFFGKNKIRLWDFGDKIGYLEFGIIPKIVDKQLEITTGTSVAYDSVDVGLSKSKNVSIRSTGNYDVKTVYTIIPGNGTVADDFKIIGVTEETLPPDKTSIIRVKFNPTTSGDKEATLKITSDAKQSLLNVSLKGIGVSPTSIENDDYILSQLEFNIFPNPSEGNTEFTFNLLRSENVEISIQDLLGRKVNDVFKGFLLLGFNSIEHDLSNIPSGMYIVNLKVGLNNYRKKFLVR